MLKVMLFSWLLNAVAAPVVSSVTAPSAPSFKPSMASQEAIRLGYVGQLMDLCGRTLGWQEDTMLEILQHGAVRAIRFGADKEMLESMYDVGAKDALKAFEAPEHAIPLLCSGAQREVMAYVHGLDLPETSN